MSDDDVNSPRHYQLFPEREAIGLIEHELSKSEYVGYLKGNILKYRLRAGKKSDALKDIQKAGWYEKELWRVLNQSPVEKHKKPDLEELCQEVIRGKPSQEFSSYISKYDKHW